MMSSFPIRNALILFCLISMANSPMPYGSSLFLPHYACNMSTQLLQGSLDQTRVTAGLDPSSHTSLKVLSPCTCSTVELAIKPALQHLSPPLLIAFFFPNQILWLAMSPPGATLDDWIHPCQLIPLEDHSPSQHTRATFSG